VESASRPVVVVTGAGPGTPGAQRTAGGTGWSTEHQPGAAQPPTDAQPRTDGKPRTDAQPRVNEQRPARRLQPALHELLIAARAPTVALSGRDGQLRGTGAHGVFHGDIRVLSTAVLTVDGREPESIAAATGDVGTVWCAGLVRDAGDDGPDPTIRVDRDRRVLPGAVTETLRITSTASQVAHLQVELRVAADLAPVDEVKAGVTRPAVRPRVGPDRGSVRWEDAEVTTAVSAPDAEAEAAADGAVLRWAVAVPARGQATLSWTSPPVDRGAVVVAGSPTTPWSVPRVGADDRRLAGLVEQGLADLDGLRMSTAGGTGSEFLAAGAPWYFTLFGRDSIWAARLLLPLGTGLALGTLRTLAALQGTIRDPVTGQAPGKILHELRRPVADAPQRHHRLPPVYYGTVDATPLWVLLLHDAWRAGLPAADVEGLLDCAERALEWLADDGSPAFVDGSSSTGEPTGEPTGERSRRSAEGPGNPGFVEYADADGSGLSNQGWKDSEDAVRFADGTRARAPIALCEVQGYAVAAARAGAALLDAFGRPGGDGWGAHAAALAARFAARFWVADPGGDHPAIALDGAGRRVDSVTSNMGHLLGTGILDPAGSAAVVHRLTAPEMDSGFGLRTMAESELAYSPLSYHCGSVWPHDTAIVLTAMSRAGFGDAGAPFVEGLLAAGAAFGQRLPELYGGDARGGDPRGGDAWAGQGRGVDPRGVQTPTVAGTAALAGTAAVAGTAAGDRTAAAGQRVGHPVPVPYPAACRPQAWSAAVGVALVSAVLGLEVDVPAAEVRLRPMRPSPVGALRVSGLRAGTGEFEVAVSAAGDVLEPTAASLAAIGLRLVVLGPGPAPDARALGALGALRGAATPVGRAGG